MSGIVDEPFKYGALCIRKLLPDTSADGESGATFAIGVYMFDGVNLVRALAVPKDVYEMPLAEIVKVPSVVSRLHEMEAARY